MQPSACLEPCSVIEVERRTPEAKVVKALDKIETILQHTQGENPPGFDYAFNLEYGRRYTDALPFLAILRRTLDEETRKRMTR